MSKSMLSKKNLTTVIESAVNDKEFQKFMEVILHAQTCPKCSQLYNKATDKAKEHLKNELS